MRKIYCVYILASRSRALYTGVTGNLHQRMLEHRQGLVPGFTTTYRVFRLVHLEHFGDIRDAIAREKEIKAWRREKKIRLIERDNPTWQDLAAQVPQSYQSEQSQSRSLTRSPNTSERIRDDKSRAYAKATTDADVRATAKSTTGTRATTDTKSPMSFRTK